jgi:hypothetical protein
MICLAEPKQDKQMSYLAAIQITYISWPCKRHVDWTARTADRWGRRLWIRRAFGLHWCERLCGSLGAANQNKNMTTLTSQWHETPEAVTEILTLADQDWIWLVHELAQFLQLLVIRLTACCISSAIWLVF